MKTTHFPFRTFIWVMQVMLSFTTITATTYQGDLPRSPFSRFLYSFHNPQKVNKPSFRRPSGATYSFTYLTQGHIATNANKTSEEVKQEDIWSTKTGSKYRYNSTTKASSRPKLAIVAYSIVSTVPEQSSGMLTFASIMEIGSSSEKAHTETLSSASGLFSNYEFGKPEPITQILFADEWDDPGDPTVPVGDGFYFLLSCSLVYILCKRNTLLALIRKQNSLSK